MDTNNNFIKVPMNQYVIDIEFLLSLRKRIFINRHTICHRYAIESIKDNTFCMTSKNNSNQVYKHKITLRRNYLIATCNCHEAIKGFECWHIPELLVHLIRKHGIDCFTQENRFYFQPEISTIIRTVKGKFDIVVSVRFGDMLLKPFEIRKALAHFPYVSHTMRLPDGKQGYLPKKDFFEALYPIFQNARLTEFGVVRRTLGAIKTKL